MKQKLTIVQVVNGFARGGGELKLLELIRLLNRDKYNIVIVSVGQSGVLEEDFRSLGYPVHILEKRFAFDVGLVFRLAAILKKYQADLVMTTLFYADVIGSLAAWMRGIHKVISWEAVTAPHKLRHKIGYWLAQKNFAVVVPVSDAIGRELQEKRGVPVEKIHRIYYGVDTRKFRPDPAFRMPDRFGLTEQDNTIFGTVARLEEQKGHRYLLAAIPHIVKKHPRVTFAFAGDGSLRMELEQLAKKLGIEQKVHFLGARTDIVEFLNSIDVFVLPSLYEGLPNVVLEAMACGKPVVATAVDGTPEAVRDEETGFLVPSKNPAALADAIIRLLDSPEKIKIFGENGRNRVLNYFSLDVQISEFEQLFDSLAAQ